MPGPTVFILQVGNRSIEAWLRRAGRMGIELMLEPAPPGFCFPDHDALAGLTRDRKYVNDSQMQLRCHWVKWLEYDVDKSATITTVS